MQKSVIANFIKQLRKTSGLSTDEVTTQLNTYGISISPKTLYGYENGTSMLNADVFVALCRIYRCDNPMNLFGNSSIKSYELKTLEKYRDLDPHGKEMVDIVLQKEWERSTLSKPAAISSIHNTPMRLISYYYRLASAGTGQIIFDMPPTKRIEIPNIPEYRKVDYAIGVNGNSMEPTFYDGDTLLIEMTEEIEPGEIGIFMVDNESYVKKLGKEELISLNPECDNVPLTENSRCMGKVIDKLDHS